MNDYVLTVNGDGDLAIRTVPGTEDSNVTDTTSVITRTDDGKLAVRVVGSGGGDSHNLGYFDTLQDLQTAYPTGEAGDWAIVAESDTVYIWDETQQAWIDTDQKGQVTSVNNQTGAVTITATDILPSQTGQSGKFLTTDGTDASWGDALANQATGVNSCVVKRGSGTVSGNVATVLNSNFGSINNSSTGFVSIGSSHSSYSSQPGNSSTSIRGGIGTGSYSVAIGEGKATGQYSTVINALNCTSSGDNSISIGANCMASATNAIQIGHATSLANGTNSDANTFKVANANGNYEIMSADGTIPTARLTKVNTTITLTAAGWSSNTQTVSITGVTVDGVVFVSPDPTDQADYTSAGILCTAQAVGTLTFTCDTVPSGDIDVNVIML